MMTSTPTPQQHRPQVRGSRALPILGELVLSFGGYYLLRALGVGVFWSLTWPGIAVALIALVTTVRRGRVDMVGFLVLCEITATIVLSLLTRDARVAALREPAYVCVGGLFCLATLFHRTPFSHVSAASVATFGDPRRAAAFRDAWRNVPRYRLFQRLLTGTFGAVMVGASVVRFAILGTSTTAGIADAVDTSNVISVVMFAVLAVTGVVLVAPARKIIGELSAEH